MGAHAQNDAAAAALPDPDWKQDFESEIHAMPTPIRQPAASNVEYDDRGRATNGSGIQDASTAARVGAFSQAGPTGLARDNSGEVNEDSRASDHSASRSGEAAAPAVLEAEVSLPTVPSFGLAAAREQPRAVLSKMLPLQLE